MRTVAYVSYIDKSVNCVFVRHSGVYTVERRAFRDLGKALDWLGVPAGYEPKYPGDA